MHDQPVSHPTPRARTRRSILGFAVAGVTGAILAACGGETATVAPTAPAAAPTTGAGAAPTTASSMSAGATAPTTTPAAMVAATTTTTTTTAPTAAAATVAAPTAAPAAALAPTAASTTAPAAPAAMPAAPVATRTTTAPKGQLNIAIGFDFPAKIDALKIDNLQFFGLAESLMRLNTENKLENLLAESMTSVNPTTWRVTLRQGVKFWDGSPFVAEDVIAGIKRTWDNYPDTKGLISPETKMTAPDARTVEFVTPQPTSIFPYALTLGSFAMSKLAADGSASIFTGPYKQTKFVTDNLLELAPNTDYWGGPPPIAKISIRNIADPNARVLGLQSGDIDMIYNFPPEAIKTFGPDIAAPVVASGRVDIISLNLTRAPFNDRDVREATALAIDRDVLNQIGLDGKGTPATTLFPPSTKYDSVPLQGTDIARAKQLLDRAGWKTGGDGVRAKDGKRLAFTLYSYPGRAELTPYAVSIQSQLKPLGYDISVKEVQNVNDVFKAGDWNASMKSNNTIATGSPLYEYNRLLLTGGGDNVGKYSSPQMDALLGQMRVETDPAKQSALSKQVQELVRQDVPALFLVALPITTAYRKAKVLGYVPNPSDYYFLTNTLSVQ